MFTDKYANNNYTKLEDGDVVMCVKTRDDHFIDGKEYKVFTDDCGTSCIFTEYLRRFFLIPKKGGYCSTNSEDHWFRKKESVVDTNRDKYFDLKEGKKVVCIISLDDHFIEGKEYWVYEDGCGEPILITENKQRFAIKEKQAGYCSTNLGHHWFYRKEVFLDNWAVKKEYQTPFSTKGYESVDVHGDGSVVLLKEKTEKVLGNSEFKGGDWVFETLLNGEIRLEKLIQKGENVSTKYASYNKEGINEQMPISRLVRATEEKRQALVVLNGEQAVPKLELTGGEAVKHLLKSQKWVLCQVSNFSETHARKGDVVALIDSADMYLPEGSFYDGGDDWSYAVPIDMNEKEITISLVKED